MILLREQACGKLNLTLDVLSKRPDGYHDLLSVMTTVSLCDELELYLETGEPSRIICDVPQVPTDRDNLCWKAAALYFKTAKLPNEGFTLTIRKRLPMQAGMAGGSADAAAMLRLLQRHYGAVSEEELQTLALQVGSDVPFCLCGGTALAEGRGERLEKLPPLPKQLCYVLVKPDFSISTPALFRQLDDFGVQTRPDTEAMVCAIKRGNLPQLADSCVNVFQPPVAASYPVVEEICRALRANGALGACMTGTGSAVFGIFNGEKTAKAAQTALLSAYPQTFFANSV